MRRSLPRRSTSARAERDQRRRAVADRRAVGDVAADRADVAHLLAAEPAQQLADVRIERRERCLRVGIGDAGADLQRRAGIDDPLQLAHPADVDHRVEHAQMLGDPQADVGRARDDAGVGMLEQQVGQRIERRRREEPALAVADRHRLVILQRLQLGDGIRSRGEQARIAAPLSSSIAPCRRDDRLIAGAAAEVAGERVVDALGR